MRVVLSRDDMLSVMASSATHVACINPLHAHQSTAWDLASPSVFLLFDVALYLYDFEAVSINNYELVSKLLVITRCFRSRCFGLLGMVYHFVSELI